MKLLRIFTKQNLKNMEFGQSKVYTISKGRLDLRTVRTSKVEIVVFCFVCLVKYKIEHMD